MTTLSRSPDTLSTEHALASRLRSAAPFLLDEPLPSADPDPAADAGSTLELLVRSVAAQPRNDRIWLLLTAIAAAYPTRGDVDSARRRFELLDPAATVLSLLDTGLALASVHGEPTAELDVVVGGVVVDVDHTAKYDLHTGIQRVSRSLLPLWDAQRTVLPAAWTALSGALRRLSPVERQRVTDWYNRSVDRSPSWADQHPSPADGVPVRLVVPWRSVLVMVEVPPGEVSDRLAAIGDYSGNRLVGVAHDAIPVVSADMVPIEDSSKFVRYLTAVKFAARMAGVSAAAASEIGGFVQTLATQGLTGPTVIEVALGSPSTGVISDAGPGTGQPTVLIVGSHEPRKNHLAVLHAAEVLWREGLRFSLLFIGGSGWGDEFPRRTTELQKAGRAIDVRRAVPEVELERAYASAAFTVFPSLHEGFGLPVAESLLHGTPVVTTNFGATAETGAHGGALLIDPRSDTALTDAMRTLLTDDATLQRLRQQIASRPERTWQDYADELWDQLVAPELSKLEGVSAGVHLDR